METKEQNAPLGLLNNFQYWRARAEQARLISETIPLAEAREAMLRVANDYDRMAKIAEQRFKKDRLQIILHHWTKAF